MTTTLNPTDLAAGIILSNGNLTAGGSVDTIIAVRSSEGQGSGKFYFEVLINWGGGGGTDGCGICTATATLAGTGVLAGPGWAGVGTTGGIYVDNVYSGTTIESLSSFPTGSGNYLATRCVAVDLTNSKIWFRTNNNNWNASGTANPATNTGGISISTLFPTNVAFAGVTLQTAFSLPTLETANFGNAPFAYTQPSGFSAGPAGIPPWQARGVANGRATVAGFSMATMTGHADGHADVQGASPLPPAPVIGGSALLIGI